MSGNKKIRVPLTRFALPDGTAWPPFEAETLWAQPQSDGVVQLDNVPFYAHGINYMDIVSVGNGPSNEFFQITGIVNRSGHRTVRAILVSDDLQDLAEASIDRVESLGCTWETAETLLAIDVPPEANFEKVMEALRSAIDAGAIFVDIGYSGEDVPIE